MQARYVSADGMNDALTRTVASGANAGLWAYLTDNQLSVRDLVNASAQVKDHLDYDGFGVVTESHPAVGDRLKHNAGDHDADTELTQFGERFYASNGGRWTREDPIGFRAGDPNLFRFVGNNATNLADPSGLEGEVFDPKKEPEMRRPRDRRRDQDLHRPPEREVVPRPGTLPKEVVVPRPGREATLGGAAPAVAGVIASKTPPGPISPRIVWLPADERSPIPVRPRPVVPEGSKTPKPPTIPPNRLPPAPPEPPPPPPPTPPPPPSPGIQRPFWTTTGVLIGGIVLLTWLDSDRREELRKAHGLPPGSELIKEVPTLGGYKQTWKLPDGSLKTIGVGTK